MHHESRFVAVRIMRALLTVLGKLCQTPPPLQRESLFGACFARWSASLGHSFQTFSEMGTIPVADNRVSSCLATVLAFRRMLVAYHDSVKGDYFC